MKRTILLSLLLGITITLNAQITVTNSTFPAAGDTLKTLFTIADGIDLQSPGADLSWDFSALEIGIEQDLIYSDASSGMNDTLFPTATLVAPFGGGGLGEAYYRDTGTEFQFLGYTGNDPLGFGIDLAAVLTPPQIEREAPLEFFDVNSSESDLILAFPGDIIPDAIADSIPFAPDSIRVRINIERLDVVDVWGSVTLPGNQSYDVLRMKRTEDQETRVEIKIGIGPFAFWQDVTDILGGIGIPGFDQLGTLSNVSYRFYSDEHKEPIAVVNTDSLENPTSIQYRRGTIIVNNEEITSAPPEIIAFPNPTTSNVTFQTKHLPAGEYQLNIFNILGKRLFNQAYALDGNQQIPLDLNAFAKGTYLYNLTNSKGEIINTRRLVVLKP